MVEDWPETFPALLQLYAIRSSHDGRLCVRAPGSRRWPVQGPLRTLPIVETGFHSLHITPRQRDANALLLIWNHVSEAWSSTEAGDASSLPAPSELFSPKSYFLSCSLFSPVVPYAWEYRWIDEYSYLVLVSERHWYIKAWCAFVGTLCFTWRSSSIYGRVYRYTLTPTSHMRLRTSPIEPCMPPARFIEQDQGQINIHTTNLAIRPWFSGSS